MLPPNVLGFLTPEVIAAVKAYLHSHAIVSNLQSGLPWGRIQRDIAVQTQIDDQIIFELLPIFLTLAFGPRRIAWETYRCGADIYIRLISGHRPGTDQNASELTCTLKK
jgi:hypothetical protein